MGAERPTRSARGRPLAGRQAKHNQYSLTRQRPDHTAPIAYLPVLTTGSSTKLALAPASNTLMVAFW
jgi:hypothetical protein